MKRLVHDVTTALGLIGLWGVLFVWAEIAQSLIG